MVLIVSGAKEINQSENLLIFPLTCFKTLPSKLLSYGMLFLAGTGLRIGILISGTASSRILEEFIFLVNSSSAFFCFPFLYRYKNFTKFFQKLQNNVDKKVNKSFF